MTDQRHRGAQKNSVWSGVRGKHTKLYYHVNNNKVKQEPKHRD